MILQIMTIKIVLPISAFLQSLCQYTTIMVLVAALLIITLSYCSAENVYCVTPTATSCSSCPHKIHCATISEYAQEAEVYFTSNTTMVFLPGDHTLDMNITVANVTRLTMRGESSSDNRATIVCSESVGLNFTNMTEFKIYSLAFTSCNRKYAIAGRDIPVTDVSVIPHDIVLIVHVALLLQSTHAELVNCSFHDNLATALAVNNTNITLAGNKFIHNSYNLLDESFCGGGGVTTFNSNLTFTGNTTFLENSALCHSPLLHSWGAILTFNNTVVKFSGTSNFINNSGGGAIYTFGGTVLNFTGTNNFINNSAGGPINTFSNTVVYFSSSGGAIYAFSNTVVHFSGTNNFINNSAGDGSGGAIFAESNVTLTFSGTVNFTNNVCRQYSQIQELSRPALTGGGVYMGLKSTLSILPNTTVYWENNHATLGGAIYVRDASPTSDCTSVAKLVPKEGCFFQLPGQNLSNSIDARLVFKNNFADNAGSALYGGAIDNCKLTDLDSHSSGEVFDMLVHIEDDNDYNRNSNISSDPLRICPCENNFPDCSKSWYNVPHAVDPGEIFQVSVVAIGQRNGTVSSTVISIVEKDPKTNPLHSEYRLQPANNTCTTLSYAVSSLSRYVLIGLHADGSPCGDKLVIEVIVYQACPPGFNLSESARSCVCEPRLAKYTNSCTVTNELGQITRDEGQQFWVGYDHDSDKLNQSDELILHPQCPFDYCVNHTVVFPLNNTDTQCAYNRSGLLCGKCKKDYSLILGTSQCEKCTNSHLFLLIPFAVMGVALVFFLLVCKLTVATGTLSGLVFYANLVGVNRTSFLPVESTNPFSIFIAWLNLDFGIETCFYNGMDAYNKTWLQFVFPVYIWVLVGLIILVSHFSRRFAKLLGNNPVSVLATLILFSYTKILRTLITVLYVTFLEYPTYNRMVWLYDANIDYLSGKHIPLFIVAVLVFLFLFLPYTFLLLFGQWLPVISHLRLFSWVNSTRLKAFMDSYHAPYKARHRYWPGLLLVLRFVLFLVFAFNTQEELSINLLTILVGTGILHFWAWVSGGVYKNWCLDALEGSFALNLIILAAATYHVKLSGGNQLAVGYTSVSIAFATFIAILVIQLGNVTGTTQYLKRKCKALKAVIRNQEPKSPTDSLPDRLINAEEYELPFHTPQERSPAELTKVEEEKEEEEEERVDEAQGRLTPVYTCDTTNI